jgi:hypothetical protein
MIIHLDYKPVNKEYLIEPEIKRLLTRKFTAKRLEEVRDVFVFQCFTGVAYIGKRQVVFWDTRKLFGYPKPLASFEEK